MKARKSSSPKKQAVKIVPKTPVWKISPEEQIIGAPLLGKVRRYDQKTGCISLTLEAPLALGDGIRIKGKTTDLTQRVERMQAQDGQVQSAAPGERVRIEVADRACVGDAVYRL